LVKVGDKFGYDSLWLSDRIVSTRFCLDPMVALSVAVGFSDRMKFGTSVLALPLRNPVVLAKQIASLDYLSRGTPSLPWVWVRRNRRNTRRAGFLKRTGHSEPKRPLF
jgi:alkanesulfonate monooxygenase SsuD/methylene tetrahydromethanopterin reductase-like flavin-dependent oxidoreductase (luciferase family)